MHQGAISKLRKHQMQAHWLLQAAGQSQHFLWSVCEMVPPPSLVSPGFPVCVVLSKLKQATSGKITAVLFPAFVVCFLLLLVLLCTQTTECSELGLCPGLGKTQKLATLLSWERVE